MSVNYMIGCAKCKVFRDIAVVSAGTPKPWPEKDGYKVAAFISAHDHHETYGKPNSLVIFNEHDDRFSWTDVDPSD